MARLGGIQGSFGWKYWYSPNDRSKWFRLPFFFILFQICFFNWANDPIFANKWVFKKISFRGSFLNCSFLMLVIPSCPLEERAVILIGRFSITFSTNCQERTISTDEMRGTLAMFAQFSRNRTSLRRKYWKSIFGALFGQCASRTEPWNKEQNKHGEQIENLFCLFSLASLLCG